jgi:predicted ATP-binding protein involved in virulence
MSNKDNKEFKIETVYLKDYKGIDEEKINLNCQSFIIWASNGKNKTSLLNSIEDLFVGKNVGATQIKNGADKSELWAVLKETKSGVRYKVKRVITEKSSRLDIVCDSDPNFKPGNGPQTWINDVLGEISFNLGDLLKKSKE